MIQFERRIVWLPVKNTTAETIPGCALMEPFRPTVPAGENGQDDAGNWLVRKPTMDSDVRVIVNGPGEIPPGETGQGYRDNNAVLLYDTAETLPLSGDTFGSKAGSWFAWKDYTGFIIDHAGNGRANAQRVGGSGGSGSLVLAKCLSTTAGGVGGVGDECYSAVIKTPTAGGVASGFADGESVWLTTVGVNGAVSPELNRYYTVLSVSGMVTVAGSARKRVVGEQFNGGSSTIQDNVHAVAGAGWPTNLTDVFFRAVKRNGMGLLVEVSPVVEYGNTGNGKVYEHANDNWRCVDPADGTVTHEIPLYTDKSSTGVGAGFVGFCEWPEWYSKNTLEMVTGVDPIVISQSATPSCTISASQTITKTKYDFIQSFFNTPELSQTITLTPP